MATANAHAAITSLNGSNYPTWKLQCRMGLMKDGLWDIVSTTETRPSEGADAQTKFDKRWDKALAIIVLSIDTSLLYMIGDDPTSPVEVWEKLANQFQKKTWANKLHLRKQLYSLKLQDGGSIQEHVKVMTETFNALSVIGDKITEEDRVVHLLASLPDTYGVLVTALEASVEVPSMETVIERLLHEERKLADGEPRDKDGEKAMTVQYQKRKGPRCYGCSKHGHFKRDCPNATKDSKKPDKRKGKKTDVSRANTTQNKKKCDCRGDSDSDSVGLIASHALLACAQAH